MPKSKKELALESIHHLKQDLFGVHNGVVSAVELASALNKFVEDEDFIQAVVDGWNDEASSVRWIEPEVVLHCLEYTVEFIRARM